ncbi:hypothetical protein [Herbiconiux liukaitaii]|uniref:hypothetical protein n=1 Tax=Herbiconiux liukaitaii TaxID=3342799 RepID=UPI0035B78800
MLVLTGFLGLALAAFPAAGFEALGLGSVSWVLGFLLTWAVFVGGIVAGVGIAYGAVEWDPDARVARLRGREVPLDTITEAWRTVSTGGAAYLIYRFVSTEGPSVRVLVAGQPMKGLDAAGLADLRRFVSELPLEVPPAAGSGASAGAAGDTVDGVALTERQRSVAVSLTEGGGRSRVSRATLLEELGTGTGTGTGAGAATAPTAMRPDGGGGTDRGGQRGEGGPREGSGRGVGFDGVGSGELAHPEGYLTAEEAVALQNAWAADDKVALGMLRDSGRLARRLRPVFLALMVLAIVAALVVLTIAVVQEQLLEDVLGSVDDELIGLLFGGGGLLALMFYLAWCASADADVRSRRRLGRSWWESKDEGERRRGLPGPLLLAWGEPARRLLSASAFVGCTLGLLVGLGSIFVFTEPDVAPVGVGVAVLAVGVALVVASALAFVRVQRAKRADAEQLILFGGWRILPPEITGGSDGGAA